MTSEARFLLNVGVLGSVWGALIGACTFAWLKGRAAERFGASLYFFSALGFLGLVLITRDSMPVAAESLVDGAVAVGFLFLAVRYNKLWLGAAMVAKGVQLGLHATHMTELKDAYIGPFNLYTTSLDLVSILISGTIFAGTLADLRARRGTSDPEQAASAWPSPA